MPELSLIFRLILATGLGALVGFERERSHKVAGLRTHALVALGSALFAIISISGGLFQISSNIDPLRVVSNIVVGIGFIGAGSILRRGNRVEGTTTAASLWTVAAIGAAAGLGLYFASVFTAIVVYIVLTFLWRLEKSMVDKVRYEDDGDNEEDQ
ncbi:MAG: MgtC/SapB family protein [Parcubacteria group bacterium]|nr:MgtC/SapB family protein [Parcubacteria group bacterium]